MARGRFLVLGAAALLPLVAPTPAAAADDVVPAATATPITLRDDVEADGGDYAIAAPYPSTIQVIGASLPLTHVEVVFPKFSYNFPDDLDIQLVGPTGIAVTLLSDVGGNNQKAFTDIALRFKDGATPLPDDAKLVSGTFAPTNMDAGAFDHDTLPSPALPPAATSLAAFNGTSPIGTWSLFIGDDVTLDDPVNTGGLTEGWSLEITVPSSACLNVPEDGFTDVVDANIHESAIDCLVSFRVASGTSPTTFTPTGNVSRAQMATFVAQAMAATGMTLPANPPDAFTDDNGTTHELRINQLKAANVIGGNGETGSNYNPSGDMRRDHMASYMAGAFEAVTGAALPAGPDAFNDDNDNPFEDDINALAAKGVITGTDGTTFNPNGTVSRAQMGSFLARFLQILDNVGALD